MALVGYNDLNTVMIKLIRNPDRLTGFVQISMLNTVVDHLNNGASQMESGHVVETGFCQQVFETGQQLFHVVWITADVQQATFTYEL
jgi:ABC-type microcin C transport system duplicated ATPase subunit YejF